MRLRVSTNRAGWQMRGKSSAKRVDLQIVARKPTFSVGFPALTAFNHNQKLRTAARASNHYCWCEHCNGATSLG